MATPASRSVKLAVRAQASETETKPAEATEVTPPTETSAVPPIEPVKVPEGSGKPVFAGGRAQEVINGRSAMLGFVAALGAELATGKSVFQQITLRGDYPPGLPFLLIPAAVLAVMVGSFAPRVFGEKKNGLDTTPEPVGPFTPFAEVINGRAAMVGFAALLVVEYARGGALF